MSADTFKVNLPPHMKKLALALVSVPIVLTLIVIVAGNMVRGEGGPSDDLPRQFWVVGDDGSVHSSNNSAPCPIDWETIKNADPRGAVIRRGGLFVHDRIEIMPTPNNRKMAVVQLQQWTALSVFTIQFLPLITFIVLIVTCAIVLASYFMSREGKRAGKVLSELRRQNLSARFPKSSEKWFGSLITNFNSMADEIESLLGKLKVAEARRSETLRELAHDVRTPLAGMRLVLDDIIEKPKLSPQITRRRMKLVLSELDYLHDLVSGLLILAQLEDFSLEPAGPLDFIEALRQEFNVQKEGFEDSSIAWTLSGVSRKDVTILADAKILTRALRNLLDNAARHAKKNVWVTVSHPDADRVQVVIRNDGVSFSPEAIEQYGQRRNIRLIDVEKRRKGSVGLGSVIAKTGVVKCGGTLVVRNWTDRKGQSGAEVVLDFPLMQKLSDVA